MKPSFLSSTTVHDDRGSLSALEITQQTGVLIRRLFWLHDLTGSDRGGHAHIDTDQVLLLISGSLTITLEHESQNYLYELTPSSPPLFLPKLTWVEMKKITNTTIVLIASSTSYDIDKSLRTYEEYSAYVQQK